MKESLGMKRVASRGGKRRVRTEADLAMQQRAAERLKATVVQRPRAKQQSEQQPEQEEEEGCEDENPRKRANTLD